MSRWWLRPWAAYREQCEHTRRSAEMNLRIAGELNQARQEVIDLRRRVDDLERRLSVKVSLWMAGEETMATGYLRPGTSWSGAIPASRSELVAYWMRVDWQPPSPAEG